MQSRKERDSRQRVLFWLLWLIGLPFLNSGLADTTGLAASIQPMITTGELIVGENRFAFGLMRANKFVENADVIVRLYDISNGNSQLTAEVNAPYRPIRTLANKFVHRHGDATKHVHARNDTVSGLYVTRLKFYRAGIWGVELLVKDNGVTLGPTRLSAAVLDEPQAPGVGSLAPRSKNLIAKDVKNLRDIDTSLRPDPRLHQVRISDAIDHGQPQLIVFATPQFCTSRMCGPVVDIVRTLLPAYEKRVAFTHQEIWQDFANKQVFPTVAEWRLKSEPWIFLVDGKGIVRAKFEGLVTKQELETELQKMLALHPTRRP